MNIRIATPQDAGRLLEIYAPYVERTCITFEYEVPTPEEFESRIRRTLEKYPYLAAEEDGVFLGYAYASAFKGRAAYDWSVETSIYVREGCTGKGIGAALYNALEELLRRQHICNLCACIAYPHPASVAFHEHFGYHTVAHFHASGFKKGKWHDMIWMEKELCPHTVPPMPFIPFPQMEH
ncbi:MAG: GNAT family N-acetyltransferase [Firmicutes bacterium]|nr:GNAT family N-acetyltransferase [Bacillota bacterium]